MILDIHTFAEYLGWQPHLHILCADGLFRCMQSISPQRSPNVSPHMGSKMCVAPACTQTKRRGQHIKQKQAFAFPVDAGEGDVDTAEVIDVSDYKNKRRPSRNGVN